MLLYSIRSKATKKYFVHTNGLGTPVWNSNPVFFKTPDAIASNLKRLCSDFYNKKCEIFEWATIKAWKNFDESKLQHFEVVVFELDILSINPVSAESFVQIEAIQQAKTDIRN